MYELQLCFIDIIQSLVRLQNEQLLKIICKEENIEYEHLKHLVPSPYEIKNMISKMSTTKKSN